MQHCFMSSKTYLEVFKAHTKINLMSQLTPLPISVTIVSKYFSENHQNFY